MIWYTEDMKHFKTTRYELNNRRFVCARKASRHAEFFLRSGLIWAFVPMGTGRRLMKKKRGISKGRGIGYV